LCVVCVRNKIKIMVLEKIYTSLNRQRASFLYQQLNIKERKVVIEEGLVKRISRKKSVCVKKDPRNCAIYKESGGEEQFCSTKPHLYPFKINTRILQFPPKSSNLSCSHHISKLENKYKSSSLLILRGATCLCSQEQSPRFIQRKFNFMGRLIFAARLIKARVQN